MQERIQERRITVLEKEMSVLTVKMDQALNEMEELKTGQKVMEGRLYAIGERISSLQSHNDERFSQVYREISNQTKWMLTGILAATTLIIIGLPLTTKLIQ